MGSLVLGPLAGAQVRALAAVVHLLRRLRVAPPFPLLVARVALDHGELALLLVDAEGQRDVADLDVVGEAPEVLLLVVLADGELVVDEVVALHSDRGEVVVVDLLELLELLREHLVEDAHQAPLLPLQPLLSDRGLHRYPQTSLLYYALHCHTLKTQNLNQPIYRNERQIYSNGTQRIMTHPRRQNSCRSRRRALCRSRSGCSPTRCCSPCPWVISCPQQRTRSCCA